MIRNTIISFFALLLLSSTAFASVMVSTITGSPMDTVQVPININTSSDISGFQVVLKYDGNSLKFIKATAGELDNGWTVICNSKVMCKLRIACFSPSLDSISGNGSIAELTFKIIKDNPSPITILSYKLVNDKARSLSTSSFNTSGKNNSSLSGDGKDGGCTLNPNSAFDPTMLLLMVVALVVYAIRRKKA